MPNEDERQSFSITACEKVISGASFASEWKGERVKAKGETAVMFYLSSSSPHRPYSYVAPPRQLSPHSK